MRLPLIPRELHLSSRPSSTAQWTTLGRALELSRPPGERIVDDEYAPYFLSEASRAVLTALQLGAPAVRFAERASLAGVSAYALCRHRFMDEHMLDALESGAEQILMLGAGYDSRAYRFAAEIGDRPVYEVDLQPISRRKAKIVAAHASVFGASSVRRVEIDFRVDSLDERLRSSGFTVGAPTYVVWEGVTPYLSREAVDATRATVADVCGTGSRIALDLWRGIDGHAPGDEFRRAATRAFALIGEPLTFACPPDRAAELLGAHGFDVIDLAESDELADRYSTDGRPTEESAYVVAAAL